MVHKHSLIRKVLNEKKNVCVALRTTLKDEKNPYNFSERYTMFYKEFKKEIDSGVMKIIQIPDISEIFFGRKVGWNIREIRLDKKIEKIRATNIRNDNIKRSKSTAKKHKEKFI